MKNNASLVYTIFLVFGDFLALIAAFTAAFVLRGPLSDIPVANPVPAATYLNIFLVVLPFWILIFALIGLYSSNIYEKRFVEFSRLLMGSFIGLTFVIFIDFFFLEPLFPAKLVPIYGFALGFLLLIIFRNLARFIRTGLFAYKVGLNNVVIVGNTAMTAELVDQLLNSRQSGYRILGVVGTKFALGEHRNDVALYGQFQYALEAITEPVHTIIQTELYADEARNRDILEYAQTHHVAYRFVPGNTELFVGNIDVELFRGSLPVIAVHQTALIGWGSVVKRLFDAFAGLLALIISAPIMLVIAIAVKLSDGGPVFLRQTRLTRYNHEFSVYKFRTMNNSYNGLLPEEAFAKMGKPELAIEYRKNGDFLPNDPRITSLGRFLRSSSLDELPQIFNVLRGDISLVGPRALVPRDLSQYEKRHTILSVKSGITGLAQVSGRKNISFDERRKLDIYYVQNWSFWLDLTILAKTVKAVLAQRGAQ